MTRKIPLIPFAALSLLLIPLIGMQLSDQVNWSAGDFLVMGILLLGAGFALQFILMRFRAGWKRIGIIALVLLAFLLLWAELAVGIFGSPLAGS